MKNSCKRRFPFQKDIGIVKREKNHTMLKEVALTHSKVRALRLCYILHFFNKLHLNTCNQSKTPQTLDSGREGGEGACAHAHMAGGTLVPSAFQIYFSFEENTLIN